MTASRLSLASTSPAIHRLRAGPHVPASLPTPAAGAILALLALLPGIAAATDAPVYALDPVHTRVMFAVEHAGFSKALGTVSGSTGALLFDPNDWSRAQLDVRVPLGRLDLGDPKWNAATLARNLLDGERFPEARFVSTQVHPQDATHAQVCGEFTLRGVTRPLCLDVTFNALKRHPMPPFRRTAGFSATAELSRKDFGIDTWPNMIGDTVELRIEAEAVRTDRATADELGAPEPLQPPGPPPDSQDEPEPLLDDELDQQLPPLPPIEPPAEDAPPPDPRAAAPTP